jgi:hypothetical protein
LVSDRVEMYRHLNTTIRRIDPCVPVGLCLEEHAVFEALDIMAGAGRCNCVL